MFATVANFILNFFPSIIFSGGLMTATIDLSFIYFFYSFSGGLIDLSSILFYFNSLLWRFLTGVNPL